MLNVSFLRQHHRGFIHTSEKLALEIIEKWYLRSIFMVILQGEVPGDQQKTICFTKI